MCAMDLDGNGGPAMMTFFFFVFVALCAVDALFQSVYRVDGVVAVASREY